MLKRSILFIILVFAFFVVSAQQNYRVYFTQIGEKTTHPEIAASYSDLSYLKDDSLWYVQQYDMRGNILTSGYYLDEQMTIPNGKFAYYKKNEVLLKFSNSYQDTLNHVQFTGYYVKGVKTGPWVEYFNGVKKAVANFQNNKLEGLYQQFDQETGRVTTEGYYVNNLKEGNWCGLAADSTALYSDIFKHGKLIKHISNSPPATPVIDKEAAKIFAKNNKAAVPHFDFQTLVIRTFDHYNYTVSSGVFRMSFIINKDGRVEDTKVIQSFETEFDELAIRALLATTWKPAISNGQPIKQFQTVTINIKDGVAQVPGGSIHKTYDLQRGTYQ